jgi:hypothetical protein
MNHYTKPQHVTREMIRDTHKFESGTCQKCGLIESKTRNHYGQLNNEAPEMFLDTCDAIQKLRAVLPYQNLPQPNPVQFVESLEPRRPRKLRLKMRDGRYIKLNSHNSYTFTDKVKEATIFDTPEKMHYWRNTINRIWQTSVNEETL